MSIDAGAQVAIILFAIRPCVVILNCLGWVLYLGRAPRTKETLPDFHELCRVTRHPRVFRGLTGCQRTPRDWGVTKLNGLNFEFHINFQVIGIKKSYVGYQKTLNMKKRRTYYCIEDKKGYMKLFIYMVSLEAR